jgi:hypothetical protein
MNITVIASVLIGIVVLLIAVALFRRKRHGKGYKSVNVIPPYAPPAGEPIQWPDELPPPGPPQDLR